MKPYLYAAIAALVLVCALLIRERDARLVERGRAIEATRALTITRDSLRRADSVLALRVAATTDTFIEWRDRWRVVSDTVRLTDTLIHRDTVIRIIAVADSTIRACDTALGACQSRVAGLLNTIANRDSTIRVLRGTRAAQPSRLGLGAFVGPCVTYSPRGLDGGVCAGAGLVLRVR